MRLKLDLGSASLHPIIHALNGRSIKKISLRGDDIGDVSEFGSCNWPSLSSLYLWRSGLTSVPSLLGFSELQFLYLNRNKIDREGFARLNTYIASDSCRLCFLGLDDTGMADEDISHFLEHSSATDLLEGLV